MSNLKRQKRVYVALAHLLSQVTPWALLAVGAGGGRQGRASAGREGVNHGMAGEDG